MSKVTDSRLLSQDQIEERIDYTFSVADNWRTGQVSLGSFWSGELRWGRNRSAMGMDRRGSVLVVVCYRNNESNRGSAFTRAALDDVVVRETVKYAESRDQVRQARRPLDLKLPVPELETLETLSFSEETAKRTAEENGRKITDVIRTAVDDKLLSAGFLSTQLMCGGSKDLDEHRRKTTRHMGVQSAAHCSITVRHPKGLGSGWVGISSYDISRLSEDQLANLVLEKCNASINPVRVEPGRYTVILEPQAVAVLLDNMMDMRIWNRGGPEGSGRGHPFSLGADPSIMRGRSKLGLKIVDERVTIYSDPQDLETGTVPFRGNKKVTWINKGILQSLWHDRDYGMGEIADWEGAGWRASYRMEGGDSTIDDMISSSERAILVTRFSNPVMVDISSMLLTGVTRDGLWLIEKGKISKSIKNFRFTESPLFALNNLEALGKSARTHEMLTPWVSVIDPDRYVKWRMVPPLKVRDFSFTSTIDAV